VEGRNPASRKLISSVGGAGRKGDRGKKKGLEKKKREQPKNRREKAGRS